MDGSVTYFAPAERTSDKVIFSENSLIGSQEFFAGIFGAMNGISAIIDKNRQIVYANNEFLELLGVDSIEPILGKRPGEVVSCVNSGTEPSGCGTAKACRYCGVVNAIMESQVTYRKLP
jgi:PAS domain-containing protein